MIALIRSTRTEEELGFCDGFLTILSLYKSALYYNLNSNYWRPPGALKLCIIVKSNVDDLQFVLHFLIELAKPAAQ